MPLIRTKGPKRGLCNICGEHGDLTEDHVPPKGTIKFPRMTLYGIGEVLNAQAEKDRRGRDFQQGVKFRPESVTLQANIPRKAPAALTGAKSE